MKREVFVLIAVLFLIVFMIGRVSADRLYLSDSTNNNIKLNMKISSNDYSEGFLSLKIYDELNSGEIITISSIRCYYSTFIPLGGTLSGKSIGNMLGEIEIDNLNGKKYEGILYGGNCEIHENDSKGSPTIVFMYGTILLNSKEDNSTITGWFDIESWINNSKIDDGLLFLDLFYDGRIEKQSQKISALESWKQTITNTITSILNTLTGHNTRISKLENSTSNGTTIINNTTIIISNVTNPYLKYLSNSDRKNMICGYAKDNHLTSYSDLGWNCTITYKARGNPICKCK